MNEELNRQPTEITREMAAEQSPAEDQNTEMSSRRELLRRYTKYALVAGPMLLFVSKAHAIHSPP